MKNRKPTPQQQEVIKRMQEGLSATFVNYALEEADQQIAKNLATEIGIPFTKIEQILRTYHTLRTHHLQLEDKEVIHLLENALVDDPTITPPKKGLFKKVVSDKC